MTDKQKKPQPSELEKAVDELLRQIRDATETGEGNYIYRGENKDYGKVSSTLYRYLQGISDRAVLSESNIALDFEPIKKAIVDQLDKDEPRIDFATLEQVLRKNISDQRVQKQDWSIRVREIQQGFVLEEVREYVDFENDMDVLIDLQHYNGKTNLIDFSYDLAVALFFACDGEVGKDGRLLLMSASADGIVHPKKNKNNRVILQKSVFVQRNGGYIKKEEFKQITIPKGLKKSFLSYVRTYFNIRPETIYGDLAGYIQNQERNSEAHEQFIAGAIYHDTDIKKAITHYGNAITLKPNFAAAYNNRGNAKEKLTPPNLQEAIDDYTEAIALNHNYVAAYNNRGSAYAKQDKYEHAIADFSEAIRLDPNYAIAYNSRGSAYAEQNKYERAIADFSEAIQLDPNYATAYNNRGLTHDKQGKHKRAIADFSEAIQLDPNYAKAYYNRGTAKAKLNPSDLQGAIDDYTEAVELKSYYAEAHHNRDATKSKSTPLDKQDAIHNVQIVLRLAHEQNNQKVEQLAQALLDNLNMELEINIEEWLANQYMAESDYKMIYALYEDIRDFETENESPSMYHEIKKTGNVIIISEVVNDNYGLLYESTDTERLCKAIEKYYCTDHDCDIDSWYYLQHAMQKDD